MHLMIHLNAVIKIKWFDFIFNILTKIFNIA